MDGEIMDAILKCLTVKTGPIGDEEQATVNLNGILPSENLTPKMARQAARVAFGHDNRVTVWDNDFNYGYRLYEKSARKLQG
jgi:hypothetical protein